MGARGLLILLGACGRYGFAGLPSDASGQGADADAMLAQQKADAPGPDAPPGDGAIAIDGAQGFGGYTLTDSTAPYTLLAGTVVPGFAPLELVASRFSGGGIELMKRISEYRHVAMWCHAVRA